SRELLQTISAQPSVQWRRSKHRRLHVGEGFAIGGRQFLATLECCHESHTLPFFVQHQFGQCRDETYDGQNQADIAHSPKSPRHWNSAVTSHLLHPPKPSGWLQFVIVPPNASAPSYPQTAQRWAAKLTA